MNRMDAAIKIKKFLANRRYVFFNKYPDPKKQQIILNAENALPVMKLIPKNKLSAFLGFFADKYILPLIPSEKSRYKQNFEQLYHELKNPRIQ